MALYIVMALYSCGPIYLWPVYMWPCIDVALYRCGPVWMWPCIDVALYSYGPA